MRRSDHERTIIQVGTRVLEHLTGQGDAAVERVLQDALFYERHRLDQNAHGPLAELDRAFWRDVASGLVTAGADQQRVLLKEAIEYHTREILGRFDPRVYALVTRLVPASLTFLLNASTPRKLMQRVPDGLPDVKQNVIVQGHSAHMQKLHRHGRIILVPTHCSHLDSPVVGYILLALNLPPFAYGAGLNLFTNPMLSFFMHNLGAYKVDRKKRHELYKLVLKEYCTVSLEYGYDNLFFPGGTRARSGAIEPHLKLGLLGCGVQAYQYNLRSKRPQPKIFIVPATLSYHLVLEAETLIDDFLQEVGKSRYIIEDDEATSPRRVYDFIKNLLTLDARIYCTLGKPLDPFGNEVDEDGISRDARGRPIDIQKYVMQDGQIKADPQRDRVYTEALGEQVVKSFHRENVVLSTHFLARALWRLLRGANRGLDLYRLLRTGGRQESFAQQEVVEALAQLRAEVEALASAGALRIDPRLLHVEPGRLLDEALVHFASYHTSPVAVRRAERIFPENLKLLLFYQNRLSGYGLDAD